MYSIVCEADSQDSEMSAFGFQGGFASEPPISAADLPGPCLGLSLPLTSPPAIFGSALQSCMCECVENDAPRVERRRGGA